MGLESETKKSQLVLEICSLSTLSVACVHRHRSSSYGPAESHFIDWYRILGVEEDADIDVIKKRYRKLALQLHPDKNKHPRAELAFKLVFEAYSYLTDSIKRRAFNLERSKNFCIKCNRIPYTPGNNSSKSQAPKGAEESNAANRSKWLRNRVREMKQRFKEEIKVMENCLKANRASRKEAPLFKPSDNCHFHSNTRSVTPMESPVFDPSDYLLKGYPHIRTRIYRKPENFWDLQREDALNNYGGQGTVKGRSYHDFPVFEKRSERGILKESAACVYT
ncbi:hypothetical protein POTOM_030658 [Populus tomentosa]|uniref:J domain-containing protein n=1 Tax=Populus tomentosa TaxID=118781 RepID=A0A8X7ZNP0_POPTO|nr:hypothetical protein POTOM_030658 [Populus tomentosa]